MKLYHITGWLGLIGREGCEALKTTPIGTDLRDLAAPGSILAEGIKPMQGRDWPDLPPCVWLNTNPSMRLDCCSYANWRLTVAVPSTDRRLVKWTKLHRKLYGMPLTMDEAVAGGKAQADSLMREGDGFYVYFGEVLRRMEIDRVDPEAVAAKRARVALQAAA